MKFLLVSLILPFLLTGCLTVAKLRKQEDAVAATNNFPELLALIAYIQCYKCETGIWPASFEDVTNFSSKSEICNNMRSRFSDESNEFVLTNYQSMKIETIEPEKATLEWSYIGEKGTPVNVNINIENSPSEKCKKI